MVAKHTSLVQEINASLRTDVWKVILAHTRFTLNFMQTKTTCLWPHKHCTSASVIKEKGTPTSSKGCPC